MRDSIELDIQEFEFKLASVKDLNKLPFAKDLWPIVYILSDDKQAYVGETINTLSRLSTHLESYEKNKLSSVCLIAGDTFNKSVTLDLESKLIKYIAGDGQYKLLNANLGLLNHNYYQKETAYKDLFPLVWEKLMGLKLCKHAIEQIDNSDLFKYSPYKTLSEDQKAGLLSIMLSLLNKDYKQIIIEGGAGTGKTVLAVFLFKLLHTSYEDFNFSDFAKDDFEFFDLVKKLKKQYPTPRMALVIPMESFRNTIKKVFKHVKGLNAGMVIGPAEIIKGDYDLVLVDESHRLRRRANLGTYFGRFDEICNELRLDKDVVSELDWILKKSKKTVLFYDANQSIRPSDTKKEDFDKLKKDRYTGIEKLRSQFRVRAGNDYIEFVDKLLSCRLPPNSQKKVFKDYEFLLFDNIRTFKEKIESRNKKHELSRLIAGYSWEWVSKNDKNAYDITIDGLKLKWNSVSRDWVNSAHAINEVGCIHTTQGYDLNYAGIIFGNEISYDKKKNEIVIRKEHYHDKNGKNSIEDPAELKAFIINIYKTIMFRGIKGTFVYVCDDELREYFGDYIEVVR